MVLLSMPFNKLPLLILGATTCTTLAFIMPGLCHYSLFRNELTKSQIFLDLFLAGFGILLAIVGTYDAVNKYNYPDPNHPHVPPIPIANSHLVQTAAANSMNSIGSWKTKKWFKLECLPFTKARISKFRPKIMWSFFVLNK